MRFALRTLLTLVTAACVALFLLFAAPAELAAPGLVVIAVILAVAFSAGVIYGSGGVRAFCVGALFPAGATFFALTWILSAWFVAAPDLAEIVEFMTEFSLTIKTWSVASWILEIVTGLVVVGVRSALGPTDGGVSSP
jgi:hypothetical protein